MGTWSQRLDEELKAAMRSRDQMKLDACRMLKSALKYKEIELGHPLEDPEMLGVVATLVKQRRDAAEQYRAGGRPESAAKEEAEIGVLELFRPPPLAGPELERMIDEAITATGAQGARDLGVVMKALKTTVAGRADGKTLSELVRARLPH
jgi:uncharacterized protein YqeY